VTRDRHPRPTGPVPTVHVEADLAVTVEDGAGGEAVGRLTADGSVLRLDVDRPEVLTASRPRVGRRGAPDPWHALGVDRLGVSLEVHGPQGRVAVLDPARHSRLSGLLTGDPHLHPDGRGVLVRVRRAARPRVLLTGALTAGLLAAAVTAARRSVRTR
jgi:hypothetical protein